jgi:hypothetical protein
MAELSQLTASNVTVEAANGVTYAHLRLGRERRPKAAAPFLQYLRGNLDN